MKPEHTHQLSREIWPEGGVGGRVADQMDGNEAKRPKGLESATLRSVCRQQGRMVEVRCEFGVSFLQMESEIWIVRRNGLHVKIQACVMPHAMREACDWPQTCSRLTSDIQTGLVRTISSTGK